MSKCRTCGSSSGQTPYYEDVGNETVQDHASVFNDTLYAAAVVVKEEFEIPAVDEDVQVCLKDVTTIVVGSYLWHPAYGSLKIVYWDGCNKKIGLLNEGITGNAPAGTVVSECTAFVPSSRPCCADQDNFQLFPFLAEDFEAPAVSSSRTIQVTSTFGLVVGTNIRIGTGVYLLSEINSSLEVVITNEGAGQTPGDIVEAKDSDGNYQYLLTTIIVSVCTATKVDEGILTVCDGADEKLLDGEFAGQVPVLQDASTDTVKFKLLDTEVRTCTTLTTQLSITPAQPSYTIDVDDESLFSIDDVIQINFSALRWTVTDNTTPGELDITCTIGNPGVTVNVASGSAVCKQFSIEDLEDSLAITDEYVFENPYLGWVDISYVGAVQASVNTITFDTTTFSDILFSGTRIKYKDSSGTYKYAYVYAKTLNISGILYFAVTTDYSVIAGDITELYYSYISPVGFPLSFTYEPTYSGFASVSVNTGAYSVNGRNQVNCNLRMVGVSNAISFQVESPFRPELTNTGNPVGILTEVKDNSNFTNQVGVVTGAPASNTLNFLIDGTASSPWTAVNNKQAYANLNFILKNVVV